MCIRINVLILPEEKENENYFVIKKISEFEINVHLILLVTLWRKMGHFSSLCLWSVPPPPLSSLHLVDHRRLHVTDGILVHIGLFSSVFMLQTWCNKTISNSSLMIRVFLKCWLRSNTFFYGITVPWDEVRGDYLGHDGGVGLWTWGF